MFHFTQNIQVRQQWRWACNLRFCATHNMGGLATPYTNHQQHTNTMSTANHSVSKYRIQAQKLEEKHSGKEIEAHQIDSGRVGSEHQICTSRLPRVIRNQMYTRLYQAPCQLCLTTSLLATDGISHEGPRFFTLVQPWRTSISSVYSLVQWNWFSEVTGCPWSTFLKWHQKTNFTAPGCMMIRLTYTHETDCYICPFLRLLLDSIVEARNWALWIGQKTLPEYCDSSNIRVK